MGNVSDYSANKILDHFTGKTAWSLPTEYVALSYADPTDDGSGLDEPTGNGYARVATAGGDWDAATARAVANAAAITFPEATGNYPSTVTHFATFDAASGGNMTAHGTLTASRDISTGETPRFDIGALTGTVAAT